MKKDSREDLGKHRMTVLEKKDIHLTKAWNMAGNKKKWRKFITDN